jgi:heptaprenyl diphosphate synthase
MMLSVSIVLSIVESFIPVFIPGVKIGLANVVTLIIMYLYGEKDAFLVLILRIVLVGILRGTIFSVTFYLSLSGGLSAYLLMFTFKQLRVFSMIGVSIMGAFGHSVGQIAMAIFLIERKELIYYLPYILVLSIITGVLTGMIANRSLSIVKKAI